MEGGREAWPHEMHSLVMQGKEAVVVEAGRKKHMVLTECQNIVRHTGGMVRGTEVRTRQAEVQTT